MALSRPPPHIKSNARSLGLSSCPPLPLFLAAFTFPSLYVHIYPRSTTVYPLHFPSAPPPLAFYAVPENPPLFDTSPPPVPATIHSYPPRALNPRHSLTPPNPPISHARKGTDERTGGALITPDISFTGRASFDLTCKHFIFKTWFHSKLRHVYFDITNEDRSV